MWCLPLLALSAHASAGKTAAGKVRPATAAQAPEVFYRVEIRLDPESRRLAGQADITIRDGAPFELLLNPRFELAALRLDGEATRLRRRRVDGLDRWSIPEGASIRTLSLAWHGVLAPLPSGLEHRDTLRLREPVADADGSFLPSAGAWYPLVARNGMPLRHAYTATLDVPRHQRALVAGHRGPEEARGGRVVTEFAFPHPSEGIDLIAGPYRVAERPARSIDGRPIALRTYFHAELEPLARGYLDAVAAYLELYERWIGPYPFTTFSVVSSPTPTGFGMPTLTYLGIEVLKLPFIKATSLGHEVLHNWWGNGVYPDYATGNWSEGLTTFMADYHYAERESADKAHAMRLAWLRELSGVPPDAARPLSAFTSRQHGVDQALGYGKAAMLFVMLRDHLGNPAFDRGIRRFWRTQRFRSAGWDDLRIAFEAEAGQQLERFFAQWTERAGLAEVALVEGRGDGGRIEVTLSQSAPPYVVEVPLRIDTAGGEATRRVRLKQTEQRFELELDPGDTGVRVVLDPDSRLLRRLHRQEAPPILRELQFDPRTALLTLGDPGFVAHARALGARLLDHRPQTLAADAPPAEHPLLVIGTPPQIDRWLERHGLPPPPPEVAKRGSTRVWTLRLASGAPVAIVAADGAAALSAASRPLPHYRQQSWLVFDGPRAIARGVWPSEAMSVPVSH